MSASKCLTPDASKTVVPERKLKIKFTTKRLDKDAVMGPCFAGQNMPPSNHSSMEKISVASTKKRGPILVVAEGTPREKRQKIDRGMTVQCMTILKKLMLHEFGWIFNQAVDPVALNIPDYFLIISEPMDLGTVKSKLQKNVYGCAEEFAADVRLTFSNAMVYNPPANHVHKIARELNETFEESWKLLEKGNSEISQVGQGKSSRGLIKNAIDTPQKYEKKASFGRSVSKRPIPSKEKVLTCSSEASTAEQVENSNSARDHMQKLVTSSAIGTEYSSAQACSATKGLSSPALRNCVSCGQISCTCCGCSDTTHVSSSDISSDRSLERDYHLCSVDSRAKRPSSSPSRKADPDSDVSTLDDEKACSRVITLVSDAASREAESTPLDVPLSPQKALRAAILKCRFADTILKAQQKALDHGDKNDSEKLKKERERLERRQREEKAKIEAEIRAAEAASRKTAEIELKRQREMMRESACLALNKMKKTVEIELNLEALEELEILCGYTPSTRAVNSDNGRRVLMASSWPIYVQSPREQFGLFIKAEYLGEEDDVDGDILNADEVDEDILNVDGEEGEIFDTN